MQIFITHCELNNVNVFYMNSLEIKEFRKKNNLTQGELAKIAGVTVRAVQSWEQNQRNITQSAIKLIQAYKCSEESEMSDIHNSERTGNLIPFYDDVTTVGGINEHGAVMQSGVSEPADYIDTGDWFKDATAALRHYGDSMTEYPPGCILALKEVQDRRLIIPGRDYVIETNEYRVTKRVQLEAEHIRAHSTNDETYTDGTLIHQPFNIPFELINKIFLILGYVVKKNGGTMVFSNQKK